MYAKERVKAVDFGNEFLWLLDEGHCFRDQLIRYCQLKSASVSKKAYSLGSIETFMRIVENGKGVTFIPELALSQLSDAQLRLVRPFAIPEPRREIAMLTPRDFIRVKLRNMLVESIQSGVKPLLKADYKTKTRQ